MSAYEQELLRKLQPSFDLARSQAMAKHDPQEQQMAELFIVGMTALAGICADLRRIADNAEQQQVIAANTHPYVPYP